MRLLRKFLAAIIGVPLIILGIILVPLPGPGFLIIFAGLVVLSLEFEWAKPHRENVKTRIDAIIHKAKAQ